MRRTNRLTRRETIRAGAVATGLLGFGARAVPARSDGGCYYQVDFVVGEPMENLGENPDAFYGRQNRLVSYVHGNQFGITQRNTWINSLDPEARDCLEEYNMVSEYGLEQEGTTAVVVFEVAEECELTLSLAVYELPQPGFSFTTAAEQELVDASTGTFGAGDGRLEATLPCRVTVPRERETHLVGKEVVAGDSFGGSVALHEGTLFVSAGDENGAVYVFDRTDEGWTRSQRIGGSSDPDSSHFGREVAVDGRTALVSAPLARPVVDATAPFGVVYVFERAPETGTLTRQRKFTATNGEAYFGGDVDVDGSTALVTSGDIDGGAVHFYERDAGGWARTAKRSLASVRLAALSDDTAVVSGRTTTSILERTAGWERVATFTVGAQGLDIDGDRIAVQARGENRGITAGEVYLFARSDTQWEYSAKVSPVDYPYLNVGESVALRGNRLLIGVDERDLEDSPSSVHDDYPPPLHVHLFEKFGRGWTRLVEFEHDYAGGGEDVDLGPARAVINAPRANTVVTFDL